MSAAVCRVAPLACLSMLQKDAKDQCQNTAGISCPHSACRERLLSAMPWCKGQGECRRPTTPAVRLLVQTSATYVSSTRSAEPDAGHNKRSSTLLEVS